MKVERIPQTPPPPPDLVVITMSLDQARELRRSLDLLWKVTNHRGDSTLLYNRLTEAGI